MADSEDEVTNEELPIEEEANIDEQKGQPVEPSENQEEEGEEFEVVVEGESPPQENEEEETKNFIDLRKRYREERKVRKEQERKIAELEAKNTKTQEVELGPKPTLESCDYDEEQFEGKLLSWQGAKQKKIAEQQEREDHLKKQDEAFQEKFSTYESEKERMNIKGFDEAEENLIQQVNKDFQPYLIACSSNPVALVKTIGGNPEKLKQFSEIKTLDKFIFEAGKLEGKVSVRSKNQKPKPETKVRGTSGGVGSDAMLDKLEAEASRTKDRSKVIAYKRKQKQGK